MGGTDGIDWYDDGSTITTERPEPPDDPRALRWPRPRILIASAAAFLLFCAGAWWLTHADALTGTYGGVTFAPEPRGTVVVVGIGPHYVKGDNDPDPTAYPLDSLRLSIDLRGNEDAARVGFAVCELTGNGRIGSAIITGGRGVGEICSSLTPFEQGQAVDLVTEQVLLLVEPLTDQPFEIGPATATYRVGFRAGQLDMSGTAAFNTPLDAAP